MSARYPDKQRPYWVEGYYGLGGRMGTRKNPNKGRPGELEGDLASATVHASESSRDTEIQVLNEREDIGSVIHGWNG